MQSGWRLALREFAQNRLAVTGVAILLFFVLFSFVGPVFYHGNYLTSNLLADQLAARRRVSARYQQPGLRRAGPADEGRPGGA